jgi:formylglycine-generating enzyme required for sulfatase activity
MRSTTHHNWIKIPGGSVTLQPGGYLTAAAEFPVPAFLLGRHPVTNAAYSAFVDAGGYDEPAWWSDAGWTLCQKWGWREPRYWHDPEWSVAECPVVGVSWFEALAYCQWLSATTGETVTLPNEQQWQRAAQGDDERPFPWGATLPDESRCNWRRNVDSTTPVGAYPGGASPYGVLDLSGNVWEWTLSSWESGDTTPNREPRLLRGGCWSSDSPYSLQVNNRSALDPNTRLDPGYRNHATVGFRCVLAGA